MVNMLGQNSRVDGAEASVTASGNCVPRQGEEIPNLQQIFEQMQAVQARLARAEQELLNVRAERDALLDRRERSGSVSRTDRHTEGGSSDRVFEFKILLDCKPSELKRKAEGTSGPNKKYKGGSSKNKEVKKKGEWCSRCMSRHTGPCTPATLRCNKCGNTGHLFRDCTDVARCFICKEAGHRFADCPKKKKNDRPRVKARAFRITADEAEEDDEVVSGTFLISS